MEVDSRLYMVLDKYDILYGNLSIPGSYSLGTLRHLYTQKGTPHDLYVIFILSESLNWRYSLKEKA